MVLRAACVVLVVLSVRPGDECTVIILTRGRSDPYKLAKPCQVGGTTYRPAAAAARRRPGRAVS